MSNVQDSFLISVVMITYNHEKFIKEAIEGVLIQQGNFEVELIIADDNSPDNTECIVKDIKANHPNGHWIKYTKHAVNKGMNKNFTWALEQAIGEYISICEGDDYWTDPLKLQKQVDFLEANPDYVICCHNAKIINENGEHIQDKKLPYLTEDRDYTSFELQQGAFLLTMSLLFRNVGVVFPKEFNGVLNGDKVLISLLGNYGKGRYIENIIPAVYRVHSGGVWSSLKEFNQRLVKRKLNYAFMKYYQENEELYSFFYNEQRELSIYLMKNIKEAESFKSYLDFNLFYIRFNSVFSSKKKLKKFLRLSKRYWVS